MKKSKDSIRRNDLDTRGRKPSSKTVTKSKGSRSRLMADSMGGSLAGRVIGAISEVQSGVMEPFDYDKGGYTIVYFDPLRPGVRDEAIAELSKLEGGTPRYFVGEDGKSLIFPGSDKEGRSAEVKAAVALLKKGGFVVEDGERSRA